MNRISAVSDWVALRFWAFVDNVIARSAAVNMTNARQQVTLALIVGTGVTYLALAVKYALLPDTRSWAPDIEWLGFLLCAAGIDGVQFLAKRATDANYVAAKQGKPPEAT